MKAALFIHAVRVTVTGKAVSPGLFEVLALLGRDEVRRRFRTAVELAGDAIFLIAPLLFLLRTH